MSVESRSHIPHCAIPGLLPGSSLPWEPTQAIPDPCSQDPGQSGGRTYCGVCGLGHWVRPGG